jgi:phosphoribosyl-ATP pyrophosphohydrolase
MASPSISAAAAPSRLPGTYAAQSRRVIRAEYRALIRGFQRPLDILQLFTISSEYREPMSDSLDRLYASVLAARSRSPALSRTSRLFRDGVQKMAKKLAEEAIEVGLDAVQMNRESVILESADVLYHLAVIWAECGIRPEDVLGELDRRERIYGIAEKLPKQASAAQSRRLAPAEARPRAATAKR